MKDMKILHSMDHLDFWYSSLYLLNIRFSFPIFYSVNTDGTTGTYIQHSIMYPRYTFLNNRWVYPIYVGTYQTLFSLYHWLYTLSMWPSSKSNQFRGHLWSITEIVITLQQDYRRFFLDRTDIEGFINSSFMVMFTTLANTVTRLFQRSKIFVRLSKHNVSKKIHNFFSSKCVMCHLSVIEIVKFC